MDNVCEAQLSSCDVSQLETRLQRRTDHVRHAPRQSHNNYFSNFCHTFSCIHCIHFDLYFSELSSEFATSVFWRWIVRADRGVLVSRPRPQRDEQRLPVKVSPTPVLPCYLLSSPVSTDVNLDVVIQGWIATRATLHNLNNGTSSLRSVPHDSQWRCKSSSDITHRSTFIFLTT